MKISILKLTLINFRKLFSFLFFVACYIMVVRVEDKMKKRVFSAIILVAVFLPFLIIGEVPFAIFMAVLSVMGLYELLKAHESSRKLPLILKVAAYVLNIYCCLYNTGTFDLYNSFDYRVLAIFIFVFLLPMVFINDTESYNLSDALFLVGSVLFIGFSFNLIITTRNYDIAYLIYLILITTLTDTFALFTGSLVGEHKLCPKISPKKTIEGLVGGVFMGTFVATAFYVTVIHTNASVVVIGLLTFMLCILGQLGDLVFSSIKRYYGVKDFSNLIPGHGGILDRFDSLIFVILAFVLLFGVL